METYKYRFDQSVPAQDLEDTFMLAFAGCGKHVWTLQSEDGIPLQSG